MSVLLIVLALVPLTQSVTMVQEVNLGETVVLTCLSNDNNHRFQFWQLQHENKFISPTNDFNREKYKYDVLSGNLTIRAVSSHEHGLYTCVCKHITKESLYSESIELVVKKDWEELYETDYYTNVFRVLLMVAVLLVLIILVFILYNVRTDRSTRFRVLADEESPDEAGPSYQPVATDERQLSDLDSHGLDTELPRPTIFTDVRLNETGM